MHGGGWRWPTPPEPMIILVWSARGLRGLRAFHNLTHLVQEATPDVLFVCESKINHPRANFLKSSLNFSSCFFVNANGSKGGLIVFWNLNTKLTILSYFSRHVDSIINDHHQPFYFTSFYGNPDHNYHFFILKVA